MYSALLTVDQDKIPALLREAKAGGVEFLPPDVNLSDTGFTIEGDAIRFGLYAIGHVKEKACEEIFANRPFVSYDDFEARCKKQKVNKTVKDKLLKAGAFDLWGMRDDKEDKEKREGERMAIGFPISTSTGVGVEKVMQEFVQYTHNELCDLDAGEDVIVGGQITKVNVIRTKKGQEMAFVKLAYGTEEYSITMFPADWTKWRSTLDEGETVLVKGEIADGRPGKENPGEVIGKVISTVEDVIKAEEEDNG